MARIFLEVLDIRVSHSCACTWSVIAFLLVVMGSCLKVSSSRGSSLIEVVHMRDGLCLLLHL